MDNFDGFLKKIIQAILNDIRMSKESDKTFKTDHKAQIKTKGEK